MTLPEFAEIFAPLALQLGATDADEATIRAYFEALKDVPIELIALAATRLATQGTERGARWFPRTCDWRVLCGRIESERRGELEKILKRLPAPLCDICSDSGWLRVDTDVRTLVERNGRRHNYAHAMTRCECQETRRLEVIGRRPLPALPETPQPEQRALPAVMNLVRPSSTKPAPSRSIEQRVRELESLADRAIARRQLRARER